MAYSIERHRPILIIKGVHPQEKREQHYPSEINDRKRRVFVNITTTKGQVIIIDRRRIFADYLIEGNQFSLDQVAANINHATKKGQVFRASNWGIGEN